MNGWKRNAPARTRLRSVFAIAVVAVAALTAACGGGGGMSGSGVPALSGQSGAPGSVTGPAVKGSAVLTIPNGNAAGTADVRRAKFISASAASVGIAINGASPIYANVSTSSSLCTSTSSGRTCTIPVSAPVGNTSFAFTLYDAANGGGNALGTGSATQAITLGTSFTLSVAINGIVASVAVSVSPASLPAGQNGTATVSVTAKDADGNTIIGPGNYSSPITLTNSDTSGSTTISPSTISAPGQTATLTYTGASMSGATLGAQVSGVGPTAITPVTLTFGPGGASPTPSPSATSTGSVTSCGTPLTLPGTYTTISAIGSYAPSTNTFSANTSSSGSAWIQITYTAAAPTAAPTSTGSASPVPSPTRTLQPIFSWFGTYQLQSGTTGCFALFASQDGSGLAAYNGTSFQGTSAFGAGSPNISGSYTSTFVNTGTVSSLSINNLTASGGSGTVSLSNGDSGTITLTSRVLGTLDEERAAAILRR